MCNDKDYTIKLDNHYNNGDERNDLFKIACCQFGFEFETSIVSREDYDTFVKLPPGDLWYYIYKQKILCDHLIFTAEIKEKTVSAIYKNGISFSMSESYKKKKIKQGDKKYVVDDYDLIIDTQLDEKFKNEAANIPKDYREKVYGPAYSPDKPMSEYECKERFEQLLNMDNKVLDEMGIVKKINGKEKIGIRFFSYILEKEKEILKVLSPNKIKLFTIDRRIYNWSYFENLMNDYYERMEVKSRITADINAGLEVTSKGPEIKELINQLLTLLEEFSENFKYELRKVEDNLIADGFTDIIDKFSEEKKALNLRIKEFDNNLKKDKLSLNIIDVFHNENRAYQLNNLIMNPYFKKISKMLIEDVFKHLQEGKISKSLRRAFKQGIQPIPLHYPMYLADDAVIHKIHQGVKWGIINYAHSAYYTLSENNKKFTLFDDAKFELKTFNEPWLLPKDWGNSKCKKRWKKQLINKYRECHYQLSDYIEIDQRDERDWQIYTHDTNINVPEFHAIRSRESKNEYDIYIAQYVKICIKNPDEVIKKIKENFVRALLNNVNVLCLPELSLLLPHEKLKNMLLSVLEIGLHINDGKSFEEEFKFSDILIFTTTYLKYAKDTYRHVDLGVGVNIQFDETGYVIEKVDVLSFRKEYYAPIEYAKNNISPGSFHGIDDNTCYKGNIFNWMDINFWISEYRAFPSTPVPVPLNTHHRTLNMNRIIITRKSDDNTSLNITLFPFICADFIANKLYQESNLINAFTELSKDSGTINIITIPSYSSSSINFYNNISGIRKHTDLIVFSNNAKALKDYGGSFIYSKKEPGTGTIPPNGYCMHFDQFPSRVIAGRYKGFEKQVEPGNDMIIAKIEKICTHGTSSYKVSDISSTFLKETEDLIKLLLRCK